MKVQVDGGMISDNSRQKRRALEAQRRKLTMIFNIWHKKRQFQNKDNEQYTEYTIHFAGCNALHQKTDLVHVDQKVCVTFHRFFECYDT